MKSFYYNVDDACFVDRTGEKLSRFVPELFYQERAEWRIFLRDGGNSPVDISDVVAWGAAVDRDYRGETAPMCRTLSGDIAADAEAGSVTVKLDAATAEFLAAVDGMRKIKAFFALYGLNRDGERELQLEFEISARMIIDPDPAVPLQAPDTLATRAYVSARIGSAADLAYASACEGMSAAMASGGYVTSSGARVVAAEAAASAASGAVFSNAGIDTVVGDYRLTYTSSGGLMVSGGGVALQVSSGGIVAAGASGESVVLSNGAITARADDGDGLAIVGISPSGVDIEAAGGGAKITLNKENTAVEIVDDGVFVNSRPVLTELVTSTDSETTGASFAVLAGGTAYVYTQPLTALTVASVTGDCDATIKFTAGAGLSGIVLPSSCYFTGESALTSGAHYFAAFNGADVVVIEQRRLSEA